MECSKLRDRGEMESSRNINSFLETLSRQVHFLMKWKMKRNRGVSTSTITRSCKSHLRHEDLKLLYHVPKFVLGSARRVSVTA